MKKNETLIEFVRDRPGQDTRYAINSKTIKKNLNFSPTIEFSKGIKDTINWYLENKNWWKKSFTSIQNPTPWLK